MILEGETDRDRKELTEKIEREKRQIIDVREKNLEREQRDKQRWRKDFYVLF